MFKLQRLYQHQSHPLELFYPRSIAITKDYYLMQGYWVDKFTKLIVDEVHEQVKKVDEKYWIEYSIEDSSLPELSPNNKSNT